MLLENAGRNTDFRPILPSKTADKFGCVRYFAYISGVVRQFYLGMVLNETDLLRLQRTGVDK
jgi:hypothetical protein